MEGYDLGNYDFVSLSKKTKVAHMRIRYLGLAHVAEGKSYVKTSALLKIQRATVSEWVKRFKIEGLKGLENKPRSGHPYKLNQKYHDALKEGIAKLTSEREGGRIKGTDIQSYIKERWDVSYSLNGIYRLMKDIRMSWISARSKHPKQNPQAQDTFKKTS